jgi:two-component system, NarL family, sensor histidine kinase UhpB
VNYREESHARGEAIVMRILVVDDHELVRKGICSLLASDPRLMVCGEAVDGREAVQKTKELRPDVVIMDISMPNMNGIEATREIKSGNSEAEIVIVSQHAAPEMVRQAFNAGARGYVVKSSISRDLLEAIGKVSHQEPFVKVEAPAGQKSNLDPQEIVKRSGEIEKATRESEERFRSAMNNMAEGLYIIDPQGLMTYLNPAAEAIFGWSSGELLGKKLHDITHYKHPDGRPFPASECPALKAFQQGIELRDQEDVFIRKDGSFFPVIYSASPLNQEGKAAGIVVCFRDDSKRKVLMQTLEERIAERTQQLERATEQLRELSLRLLQTQDEERRRIARELHDGVGQLLAAMSMNISLIDGDRLKLSPEALKAVGANLKLIEDAGQEIRTMSHLLHPPLLDEVGLDSALRWYVDGFAERSKISVDLQLAPGFSVGLPRDFALSLFRIVQECLTNIHRHSGSLSAFVAVERSASAITLTVNDQGRGMAPDLQARIATGESSGVGFRGMRERIRQFGGRLEVSSDENGTRILAVLPFAPVVQASAGERGGNSQPGEEVAAEIVATESERAATTILCIDDETAGLLPRRLLLESAGYRVIEARSGLEGIRLFQSEKVDAVILDYWMSGMKGTQVASELKRINPNVPIIVLSGMLDLPGEASGLVDEWMIKGSTRAEQLLNSINGLLEQRRSN